MGKNWPLRIGASMFLLLLFIMFVGPHLPFIDTKLEFQRMRFYEDGSMGRAPFPPSLEEPLGSDLEGRDMLSLLVMGAEETIFFILSITFLTYFISIPLALLALNKNGIANWLLMVLHSFFSSLPQILIAIIILKVPIFIYTEDRTRMIITMFACIQVGRVGTLFAEKFSSLSKQEYVQAAITIGNTPLGLVKRYYLPNMIPEVIVNFFIDAGRTTLLVGQLGILEIFLIQKKFTEDGFEYGSVDWATLLSGAKTGFLHYYWISVFPAMAIGFAIFAFYLLGEGLRRYFNRRLT